MASSEHWAQEGFMLLVDKPAGVSSAQVVGFIKRICRAKKVGHGGTLDPFATGLLPILVGRRFTRKASEYLQGDKEYLFVLRFGSETDTGDFTGRIVARKDGSVPEVQRIAETAQQFVGTYQQEVPIYSAAKYRGKPFYWYARRGETTERRFKEVTIHSLELLEVVGPDATFRVRCSHGTYVRVLGRDLARALSTYGHLVALRRERVGPFHIRDSIPLWRLGLGWRKPKKWQD